MRPLPSRVGMAQRQDGGGRAARRSQGRGPPRAQPNLPVTPPNFGCAERSQMTSAAKAQPNQQSLLEPLAAASDSSFRMFCCPGISAHPGLLCRAGPLGEMETKCQHKKQLVWQVQAPPGGTHFSNRPVLLTLCNPPAAPCRVCSEFARSTGRQYLHCCTAGHANFRFPLSPPLRHGRQPPASA